MMMTVTNSVRVNPECLKEYWQYRTDNLPLSLLGMESEMAYGSHRLFPIFVATTLK